MIKYIIQSYDENGYVWDNSVGDADEYETALEMAEDAAKDDPTRLFIIYEAISKVQVSEVTVTDLREKTDSCCTKTKRSK